MRKIPSCFCIIFFVLTSIFSSAQNNNPVNRLKVFIDCKAWNCPFDYIRSEINFVDYVNDRYAANVFILLTSSTTGGGGQEYNIYFEGLEDFKSLNDTLGSAECAKQPIFMRKHGLFCAQSVLLASLL